MKHTKLADTLKTAAVLALTTAIGFLLEAMGLSQTNVITVYILGVLVVAAVTSSRWYSTAASLASVLLFNYIFTEPMFVLKAEDAGTQLTLLITFLAAVFTSTYTVQIKEKARLSQQDAYLSGVILDTSQILQKAGEPAGILFAAATQLNKLLKRDIACFQTDENGLLPPVSFTDHSPHPGSRGPSPDTLEEMSAARRCYMEGQETGAATSILSTAAFHYLPVQSAGTVYGVIGIRMGEVKPDDFENSLAIAILNQCATSMEKEFISRKREEETAMAKAEQLRSNLLRSMYHDLRTPLTAQVVATAHQVPTCLATCVTQHQLLAPYEEKGCQILSLPSAQGHVSLPALLERLGEMEVDSVLLEGGAALHWSAVQAGIVNKVQAYLAPKILGGQGAKSPVGGQGFPHPDQALRLAPPTLTRLGEDILLESEVIG